MSRPLCDGCGRAGGEREVYCAACGRPLPGRTAEPSEAAPPGWLVASGRGEAASFFEPLPSVAVVTADPLAPARASRGWNLRVAAKPDASVAAAVQDASAGQPALPADASAEPTTLRGEYSEEREPELIGSRVVPLPPTLPVAETGVVDPRPPLRALYLPLLALILATASSAVVLLVLHILRDG